MLTSCQLSWAEGQIFSPGQGELTASLEEDGFQLPESAW